ncbi:uncharacterized protein B0I36DRAFT_308896 [Microdochium trichocladiopsis]|uniref:Uncharacterized protein n=1 Tax=Microdochium trichocladiopsis TaxID=1682393 RepID=A0A9P8YID8_9PEZI|nr:uncharacterized protein B0I36DRAFT_308896 [Microdochium trichocladiopsis]KAH7039564.1 hypothetical protein B0I36DRAFT_308896 [Microdochium trichocladiopsis]
MQGPFDTPRARDRAAALELLGLAVVTGAPGLWLLCRATPVPRERQRPLALRGAGDGGTGWGGLGRRVLGLRCRGCAVVVRRGRDVMRRHGVPAAHAA